MFLTDEDQQRADWEILRHGAVALFWRRSRLHEAAAQLRELGYEVIPIDCSSWIGFRRSVSEALRWHEQFGYAPWDGNLNALNDALNTSPFKPGRNVALSFEAFDNLLRDGRDQAEAFLDVFERQSRDHLLEGSRLLALVRVDDATCRFEGLGARDAQWNCEEWFDRDRGLG
jgi:hypothetical protein